MDKAEILAMDTPDLDWLVATALFGWVEITDLAEIERLNKTVLTPQKWYLTPDNERRYYPPTYASNIGKAWVIVERLQELEYWVKIIAGRNGKWEPSATVHVGKLPDLAGNPSREIAYLSGVGVPEAICKMALVATLVGK